MAKTTIRQLQKDLEISGNKLQAAENENYRLRRTVEVADKKLAEAYKAARSERDDLVHQISNLQFQLGRESGTVRTLERVCMKAGLLPNEPEDHNDGVNRSRNGLLHNLYEGGPS